jgi:hypothetical protein
MAAAASPAMVSSAVPPGFFILLAHGPRRPPNFDVEFDKSSRGFKLFGRDADDYLSDFLIKGWGHGRRQTYRNLDCV